MMLRSGVSLALKKNKDILIHFLNDILGFTGKDEIKEIEFLSTIQDLTNANSGLRKEESIGNRRLFGFDGIGNESRKDMNQKINRGSMANVFNF